MLLKKRAFKKLFSLVTVSLIVVNLLVICTAPAGAAAVEILPSPVISPPVKGDEPLSVNINYSIEFTLDIASGLEQGNIVLSTQMEKVGANYWELLTPDYEIADTDWLPGKKDLSFTANPGTPTFKLTGYIPENYTTIEFQDPMSGTITLHQPGTLAMLSLALGSGEVLESMIGTAIDDSIARTNILLDDKNKALADNSQLAEVIDNLIAVGHTDQAITILDTLPSEGWGSSGSSGSIGYIVAAVLAVIAVLFLVLMVRVRSTLGFLKQRVSDHADQLDIVESRVNKLGERSLTSEIAQIRDNLKEMGRR